MSGTDWWHVPSKNDKFEIELREEGYPFLQKVSEYKKWKEEQYQKLRNEPTGGYGINRRKKKP